MVSAGVAHLEILRRPPLFGFAEEASAAQDDSAIESAPLIY
jgi:hypothetical protein